MAETNTSIDVIRRPSRLSTIAGSDLVYSFLHSRITIVAALVTLAIVLAALLAPWIATQDPYDLRVLSLLDSHNPPAWLQGGDWRFPLGNTASHDPSGSRRASLMATLQAATVRGALACMARARALTGGPPLRRSPSVRWSGSG